MKIIEPSVELFKQEPGLLGIYKQIERVGRTCYKSEDRITEDSAKPFVERMCKSQHYAMCEHGTVYLAITNEDPVLYKNMIDAYMENPYSRVSIVWEHDNYLDKTAYITTNYRVIKENEWDEDLQYLCAPTKHHARRICLKFTTSIGVSREFNRHRAASMAEQSTRYCNYSREKFGNEVSFVRPTWVSTYCPNEEHGGPTVADIAWSDAMRDAEANYFLLLGEGWKPQQARESLPLSTATEVVYTAFEEDWSHFFDLRYRETTGAAHPNAKQVAIMAHDLILKELKVDL